MLNVFLMMKKIFLFFILYLLQHNVFAKNTWQNSFSLGYGTINANQNQTVHLNDTPDPGLDNGYVGKSKNYGATLIGLSLEKQFELPNNNSFGSAGFEFDYLGNKTLSGTVEPMINVSPDFDILNYMYIVNSFVFQATAKYAKQNLIYNLGTYVQAGFGAAINILSDYYEFSPEGSTASPMLSPFGDRNTLSAAFSAGIGLTYKVGHSDTYFSFGYRYFYAGRGRLNRSSVQQTTSSINLSPITYQFLVLSLTT